jgi:hypothetical protein
MGSRTDPAVGCRRSVGTRHDRLERLRTTFRWKADGRRLVCDLLREAVDGLVGEDPPAGWRAVSR